MSPHRRLYMTQVASIRQTLSIHPFMCGSNDETYIPSNHHTHIHTQEETRARVARTEAAAQRSGKTLGEMKWAVWCVPIVVFLTMPWMGLARLLNVRKNGG